MGSDRGVAASRPYAAVGGAACQCSMQRISRIIVICPAVGALLCQCQEGQSPPPSEW